MRKTALHVVVGILVGSAAAGFLSWVLTARKGDRDLLRMTQLFYWEAREDRIRAYFSESPEIAAYELNNVISLVDRYAARGVVPPEEKRFDLFLTYARLAKIYRDSGNQEGYTLCVSKALSYVDALEIAAEVRNEDELFEYLARADERLRRAARSPSPGGATPGAGSQPKLAL